jgi:hypothetical protein
VQQPLAVPLDGQAVGLQVAAVQVGNDEMHCPLTQSLLGQAEVPSGQVVHAFPITGHSAFERHMAAVPPAPAAPLDPPAPPPGHGGKNVWHLPLVQAPLAQDDDPSGHT